MKTASTAGKRLDLSSISRCRGIWGHMVGGEGWVASIQSQSREPEQHGAQRAHTAFKALLVTEAIVWGL